MDYQSKLISFMQENGIEVDALALDGQFHRLGPKKSQWYIGSITLDDLGREHWVVSFGDWRHGTSFTKSSSASAKWSKSEKKFAEDAIARMKADQAHAKKLIQAATAIECQKEFAALQSSGFSPYLVRKRIDQTFGAKVDAEGIVHVPMQDVSGEMIGVQRVYPDGSKYFTSGQRVAGGFFVMGNFDNKFCYMTEGFATAATIWKATGETVIVAFNANNLMSVAEALHEKGKRVVVCADNDQFSPAGNIGIKKASEVEKRFGFKFIAPVFQDLSAKPTDFNDLEVIEGLHRVRDLLIVSTPPPAELVESEPVKIDGVPSVFEIQGEITEEETKQTAMSAFLIRASGGRIFYDSMFDRWWIFEGVWRAITKIKAQSMILEVMKQLVPAGFSASFFNGVFNLFTIGVERELPENDRGLIPFRNGYLRVIDNSFHSHSPSEFFDWHIPCDYTRAVETPTCDEVFHNLAGGDPSKSDYWPKMSILKSYLAAIVRGMSDLQKYLELIGESGAGKSTYMNLAMMLVGEQNCHSSSLQILHKSPWETSMFLGKRLVVFPDENDFGGNGDVLKSATGLDPLRYEPKGKAIGSSFIYRGMIIVSANNYITFSDKSNALVRRRIPIKIENAIEESKRDTKIMDRLRAEVPALINQLVAMDEESVRATLSSTSGLYAEESVNSFINTNIVARWMVERCEFGPNFVSPINGEWGAFSPGPKPLYEDFRQFCETEGEHRIPKLVSFAKQLRPAAKVLKWQIDDTMARVGTNPKRLWKGLRVKVKSNT
jgi:putative DNA primase/helicase